MANTLEKNKAETVKTYLTGLRSYHVDRGEPTDVFDDPRIKRIILGAQRVFGTTKIRERREITRDILLAIVPTFTNSHDDINLRAAFTVAFSAFLRPGEFTWDKWDELSFLTHVSRGSITFKNDGAVLHLPKSKTDQFRKGCDIAIAPANDAACAVAALRILFQRYPRHDNEPLFARTLGPFDKRWIADNLTSSLLKAGLDPTAYSGHSFRRGATNSAVAAGIPLADISKLGRWKSTAIERYITPASSEMLLFAANKQLQLAPSNSANPLHPTPPERSSTSTRGSSTSRIQPWAFGEVARQTLRPSGFTRPSGVTLASFHPKLAHRERQELDAGNEFPN
jgi:integrase